MKREKWGVINNKEVELFSLQGDDGFEVKITNYGGAIVSLLAPDLEGKLIDVVLGYDSLEDYVKCTNFLGVLVGRYANRIEKAEFPLETGSYKLTANEGQHHIHGGPKGFSKQVWDAEILTDRDGEAIKLSYASPSGEEGYPGNLQVSVIYEVNGTDLIIEYLAETDQATIVNLTNHSYFNLAGHKEGSVLDHRLKLNGDFYTPVDQELITTGEIRKVAGTPFDFREATLIGEGIEAEHEQIKICGGYDHNWIVRRNRPGLAKAACVEESLSGRKLEVWTTKPGIQFYSGNFLTNLPGKDGASYTKWGGFCLETQFFPNSPNYCHFPSPVLQAGQRYQHTTIFRFS